VSEATIKNHAAFIWSVADLLRGDYKQSEYGKVILPLVVLRRLDCVLEPILASWIDRASESFLLAMASRITREEHVLA
jgi:type I restriction enzyme M protein